MRLATALIVIIGASASVVAAASRLNLYDEPESAARMLDIKASGTYQEELSGRDVTELRFYTTARESLITWRLKDTVFLYPVKGDTHLLGALALHRAMSEHGLATFIAEIKSMFLPSNVIEISAAHGLHHYYLSEAAYVFGADKRSFLN